MANRRRRAVLERAAVSRGLKPADRRPRAQRQGVERIGKSGKATRIGLGWKCYRAGRPTAKAGTVLEDSHVSVNRGCKRCISIARQKREFEQ